jgi:hypothetical protein
MKLIVTVIKPLRIVRDYHSDDSFTRMVFTVCVLYKDIHYPEVVE